MIEYVAYQLNTDLSRAAEGTGPVKPDNLCDEHKVPNPAGNRKIRVQTLRASVLSVFVCANLMDVYEAVQDSPHMEDKIYGKTPFYF